MKNKLKTGLTIFLITIINMAKADWKQDTTATLPRYIGGIYMINKDIRLALHNEFVYRTTNAGKSWTKDKLFAKGDFMTIGFQKIEFINNSIGFIQYQFWNNNDISGLYTSLDSGVTWSNIPLKTNFKINEIHFLTEKHWLAYHYKSMEQTIDGGLTWQIIKSNLSDSILIGIEVLEKNELFAATRKNDSIVNLNLSLDIGKNWEKIAEMNSYSDSDSILTFEYFFLFKVIKTSLGYLILYGNHFEPKSGYSNLYVLTKDNNNWVIKPCNFKFASPVCQIFNLKDTIHLITAYNIYKSDDSGKTWFPVFNIDKSSPFDFIGFYYTNNTLYTTTRDGVFYKNTNPNGTKIASTKSNFKSPLFSVFPNPANSNVTFSINNRVSQVELFLFDMNGKQVFNKKIAGLEEFKLNIEFLPSGNYQYLILSNTETQKGQFSIIK